MQARVYQTEQLVHKYELSTTVNAGCAVMSELYKCVYQIVNDNVIINSSNDALTAIKKLYLQFNGFKPVGCIGRPISKSDVIEIDGIHYFFSNAGWLEVVFK